MEVARQVREAVKAGNSRAGPAREEWAVPQVQVRKVRVFVLSARLKCHINKASPAWKWNVQNAVRPWPGNNTGELGAANWVGVAQKTLLERPRIFCGTGTPSP